MPSNKDTGDLVETIAVAVHRLRQRRREALWLAVLAVAIVVGFIAIVLIGIG